MKVQEELELFKRYSTIFTGSSNAVVGISSVHLAQQLERYISPSLDLGWIIRCILDINSQNLFSNSRTPQEELGGVPDNSVHPEYKYAEFLIKLCSLFIYATTDKELTAQQAKDYMLTKDSEFYFGEELAMLNRELIGLVSSEAYAV